MDNLYTYVVVMGMAVGLFCLWKAMKSNRCRRLLQDTPTSKTSGVFIGFVELKGTAEAEAPVYSYLASAPCIVYSWDISEHWSRWVTERYTDSNGRSRTRIRHESGWTSVASGGESVPFYLRDDSGMVLVQPDGAKLEMTSIFDEVCGRGSPLYYGKGPSGPVASSDHRRRFAETAIRLHQPVYVCGQSRLREDVVAPEIGKSRDAPMFMISVRDEKAICNSFAWSIYGWWFFGILFFAGGWAFVAYTTHNRAVIEDWIGLGLYAALGFFVLTAIGWVWMVFDSLVRLRQRVLQGKSLIDVQLKRRHDLIPNLVGVVKGLSDHETLVQTTVAELRAQAAQSEAGQATEALRSCASRLAILAENYPDLKTNGVFLKLQDELTDTENRIALARGYFNEIATYYNSRIDVVPDKFVAAMVAMKPQSVMVVDELERAPVNVHLSQ